MPGYELIDKSELKSVEEIFTDGNGVLFRQSFENLRNDSYKVRTFENKFKKKINSRYALAVSSGTAALRIALASIGVKRDDEVITQCFTFVATVESIVEAGAIPICTEIDETLNMCPIDLEKKITNKTKAVIVVHMLGTPAKMSQIRKICNKKKIFLIEDTAWGIFGKYSNKFLGTIGDIGTFSFDHAKTITTGEGGMIIFKKKSYYLAAKAWHDHGHENNPKVPRWEDTRKSSGFNFRMSELQGAVGLVQLDKASKIVKTQIKNSNEIWSKISKFKNIKKREEPKNSISTYDSLIFFLDTNKNAKKLRYLLLEKNISTKILPEAITWHFAGEWDHIDRLVHHNKSKFQKSRRILSKAVSIPIFVKQKPGFVKSIVQCIKKL